MSVAEVTLLCCIALDVADSCCFPDASDNDDIIIIVVIIIIRTQSLRCSWCSEHSHVRRNQKSVKSSVCCILVRLFYFFF